MCTPNCDHTGTWQPFTQQQIIQHAHNCEYIMWISDVAFLTPWNIYNPKMSLNSYIMLNLCKDWQWQIRIQSSINRNHNILSGYLEGKCNSIPLVDESTNNSTCK